MSDGDDPTLREAPPRTIVPLRIEEVIMAAGMAGIALITFANVATRYLTNISLAFTEEYSVFLMLVVTLVGAGYATACGRHIRIGHLVDRLAPRTRRGFETWGLALTILCFGILGFYGGLLAWDEYRFEVMTPGLGEPQWIFTAALPVCSAVIILRAIGRGFGLWRVPAA